MKKIKKILSIFIVSILSVCTFSLVGCKGNINNLGTKQLSIKPIGEGSNIAILCSEAVATSSQPYLTKHLEAVITREDQTTSTDCSWSVRWGTNPLNEDVSNYIRVETESVNKAKVFVYCYKTFYDSTIIIEAKDNLTGNTATCECSYIGVPQTPYFEYNGNIYTNYAELTLDKGEYSFDLGLRNALGSVDDSGAKFSLGTVYGNGEFMATKSEVSGSSTITETDMTIKMSDSLSAFITCNLNGDVLTFTIKQTVNTYYTSGGRGWINFKDYSYPATMAGQPMPCTINIPITEELTGVNMLVTIKPLTNITLNNYRLNF